MRGATFGRPLPWGLIARVSAVLVLTPTLVLILMALVRYYGALVDGDTRYTGLPPVSAGTAWYLVGLDVFLITTFLTLTIYIIWKAQRWFDVFTVTALMFSAILNLGAVVFVVEVSPFALRLLDYLAWLLPLYVYLLFPTGRFNGWSGKVLAVVSTVVLLLAEIGGDFSPYSWLGAWLGLALIIAVNASGILVMLLRLWKLTDSVQRQQVKLAVFGLTVGWVAIWAYWLPGLFWRALRDPTAYLHIVLWARPIYFTLFSAVPVCFAISIVKYRLWGVDFVINRTLLYTALLGALGILNIGLFTYAQNLLPDLLKGNGSVVAMALAGLETFAFRPFWQSLERLIGRYFEPHARQAEFAKARSLLAEGLTGTTEATVLQRLLTGAADFAGAAYAAFFVGTGPGPMARAAELRLPAGLDRPLTLPECTTCELQAGRPALAQEPFCLYLPVVGASGALRGVVALGPPCAGGTYDAEMQGELKELAATAAHAVEISLLTREQRLHRQWTQSVMEMGHWLEQGGDAQAILHGALLRAKAIACADTVLLCHSEPGVRLVPAGLSSDALNLLVTAAAPERVLKPVPLYRSESGEANREYAACCAALDQRSTLQGASLVRNLGYAGAFTLAVPLCNRTNQVVAVLEVNDPHDPESGVPLPFTTALVEALELLAALAVLALEQAERAELLKQENETLRRQVGLAVEVSSSERFSRFIDAFDALLAERAGRGSQ